MCDIVVINYILSRKSNDSDRVLMFVVGDHKFVYFIPHEREKAVCSNVATEGSVLLLFNIV